MEKYLRIADVARSLGLTLGTCYNLSAAGVLPPPRLTIGTAHLYAREDIAFFKRTYRGRPARRKSHCGPRACGA